MGIRIKHGAYCDITWCIELVTIGKANFIDGILVKYSINEKYPLLDVKADPDGFVEFAQAIRDSIKENENGKVNNSNR